MGYLFLIIALFAGVTKGYCGKKTSVYTNNLSDAVFANTVRMLLCIVIGLTIILASGEPSALIPSTETVCISALSGISTAVFVVTWLVSVKKGAYMMLDLFLMLGVLIPLTLGRVFFDETIKVSQWIGIAVLLVAVGIMCSYNNSIKTKITPSSLALLIICGIANGTADFSQKLFVKYVQDVSVAVFNLYTYIFAAVALSIVLAFIGRSEDKGDRTRIKKITGYILVMAVALFVNSYFKTKAAGYLSAVLLYPLNQGGSLVLSALMAATMFREKLTAKAVLGIATAFVGLLIINLL